MSKPKQLPAMKPLLMMRTRGIYGPVAGKHKSVPRKSKSVGHFKFLNP